MQSDLDRTILEQRYAIEARPRLSAIPPKGGRKSDKWLNTQWMDDYAREEAYIRLEFAYTRAAAQGRG